MTKFGNNPMVSEKKIFKEKFMADDDNGCQVIT